MAGERWGEVLGVLMPGPDTRVVELRVHGYGRVDPAVAVGGQAAVDVAGNGTSRLVRPADRLLRPAPGPVLVADGHPVPRTVEAYLWDGMRPRGRHLLRWALLLPCTLMNTAYWTLPATGAYTHLEGAVRAALRVCALLLTALLAGQLTVLTLDVLAGQCLSPGVACLSGGWHPPAPLRGMAGLLPVALAALAAHHLARRRLPVRGRAAGCTLDVQDGLGAEPAGPALPALHTTTALASASWLTVGGAAGPVTGPGWLWASALAVLGGCLIATTFTDPESHPGSHAGSHPAARPADRWGWRSLVGGGVLLLALSAVLAASAGPGARPGSGPTVQTFTTALAASCVLLAGLLALLVHRARSGWRRLPDSQHPWLGGWLALPLLVLAGYLGAGIAATATLAVQGLIGAAGIAVPALYQRVMAAWGVAALVLIAAAAAAMVVAYRGHPDQPLPELDMLDPDAPRRLRRTWRVAALYREHPPHVALLSAAALVAASAVGWVVASPAPPRWLVVLGAAALATLTLGAAGVGWVVDQRPGAPRRLALLHDLATGWPRTAHPLGPPSPALAALPELVDRARHHLADSGARVVLVGEGYGAVLTALAASRLLGRLDPVDTARLGLMSVGAPLQWGYQRGFPAAVPPAVLTGLSRALGPRWRALCRGTDPGGGGVTTWSRSRYGGELLGIGLRPDGSMGPLKPATAGRNGAVVLGGDHWLADPQNPPPGDRRWHPGLLRSADYASDAEWDAALAVAAGLVAAGPVRKRRAPGRGVPPRVARAGW